MLWKETEDNNRAGVYLIRCLSNNKVYVGSTCKSFLERWNIHLRLLKANKHHSNHLQFSFNKLGIENFEFSILEIIDSDRDFVLAREQYFIDLYNSSKNNHGFNICKLSKSNKGTKRSKITRSKIAAAKIGNQNAKGIKRSVSFKLKVSNSIAAKKSANTQFRVMTEADRDLISRLLEAGEPVLKISKLFGFSRGRIYNIKKEVDERKCRGSKTA